MKSAIRDLIKELETDADSANVHNIEDSIADGLAEAYKEESFYSIPFDNIRKIINKSECKDDTVYQGLISKLSDKYPEDAPLVLNDIKLPSLTFEEIIKVISSLKKCQLCTYLGEKYREEQNLPIREDVIKPAGFINDIIAASEKGKLESVKYHCEVMNTNVNKVDEEGKTALHRAALKGREDVVKYLAGKAKANIEAYDKYQHTPLHYAAMKGNMGIIKFLVEECNANVEAEGKSHETPLDRAVTKNHMEAIKYFIEECHANITDYTLKQAKNDETRSYIQSKR